MKQFVKLLLLLIFPLIVLANCSLPIGSIESGGPSINRTGDSMWLVPRRQLYQIDERFLRNEDFQVFLVEDGVVSEILPNTQGLRVLLSGNHNLSTEFVELVTSTHHAFFRVGRHVITVEYADRSASYSLEVFSPNNGNSIGGDDGIGIIWLD